MYKGTKYRRKLRRRRKKRITAFLIIFLLAATGGAIVLCRPMFFGGFQKQSGRHIKNTALFKVNIEKRGYVPGKNEEPVRAEETLKFKSEETEVYENDMPEVMERDMVKSIAAKRVSPAEICIMWNGIPDDGDVEGGQYVMTQQSFSCIEPYLEAGSPIAAAQEKYVQRGISEALNSYEIENVEYLDSDNCVVTTRETYFVQKPGEPLTLLVQRCKYVMKRYESDWKISDFAENVEVLSRIKY